MEDRRREFVSIAPRHMTALALVLTYRPRFSHLTMEASLVTSIIAP